MGPHMEIQAMVRCVTNNCSRTWRCADAGVAAERGAAVSADAPSMCLWWRLGLDLCRPRQRSAGTQRSAGLERRRAQGVSQTAMRLGMWPNSTPTCKAFPAGVSGGRDSCSRVVLCRRAGLRVERGRVCTRAHERVCVCVETERIASAAGGKQRGRRGREGSRLTQGSMGMRDQ